MKIADDLPDIGLKPEAISRSDMFLHYAETSREGDVCICNDGALLFFWEILDYDYEYAQCLFSGLKSRSVVQLYRLKVGSGVRYFCAVKVYLDYSVLKMSYKDTIKRFFVGCDDVLDRVETMTVETIDKLRNIVGGVNFIPPVRKKNALYEFLFDCVIRDDEVGFGFEPYADMSVVTIGEDRFLGMFSLNNIHHIRYKDVLLDYDFLQVFTYSVPSPEYGKQYNDQYSRVFNLIDFLDMEIGENTDESEAVKIPYKDRELSFYSNVFVVGGSKPFDLSVKIDKMRERLLAHELVSYLHTNSAREQYISCLPGNGEFGYYYQIDNRELLPEVAGGFLEL